MNPDVDTRTTAMAGAPRRYQIRPLSTGEVLDRTISLYGGNFWLCTGIASLSALVSLLSGASRLIYLQVYHLSPLTSFMNSVPIALITIFWGLIAVLAYGLSHAALTWGLGCTYLGRAATLGGALSVVRRHVWRYPGLVILQWVVAGWPTIAAYVVMAVGGGVLAARGGNSAVPGAIVIGIGALLVLVSFPFSILRYLRLALSMPASVLEDLAIRPALQRSRALLPDRKGRVFVIFLLAGALYLPLSTVAGVMALMSVRGAVSFIATQATTLLLTFASALLIQPLFSAAFVVLYYDERVRREGFDIQFMMSEAQSGSAQTNAAGALEQAPYQGMPAGVPVQGMAHAGAGAGYANIAEAGAAGQTFPGA